MIDGAVQAPKDVSKLLDEIGEIGETLTKSQVDEIADFCLHNPEADEIVLGKYSADGSSYDAVAEIRDPKAAYFSTGDELWDSLSHLDDNEIWKINKQVIDDAIASGKEIRFSHDPNEWINRKDAGFYGKELKYLEKLDYAFEADSKGGWYAVKE